VNAFYTSRRDGAGRAQYAGTRAWEGCASWRGEQGRRGPGRSGTAATPVPENPLERGAPAAAAHVPPPHAHSAPPIPATDSTPHAQ
jgi:hypothetical protein